MTPAQQEEQRRSFAYGNTKIENEKISKEIVDLAAADLDQQNSCDRRERK